MRYVFEASPMQTTASRAPVVVPANTLKTFVQAAPLVPGVIIEWGVSFDGFAAALPGKVELIETDVAATVTAYVAADISKQGPQRTTDAPSPAIYFTLGTGASGYGPSSAEGSIAAVVSMDPAIYIPPTGPFVKQFALGREPLVIPGKYYRIRMLFGAIVNAYPYFVVEV